MFTPYLFGIWAVVEIIRLYVGYKGNLQERVPNLSAFLGLTFFPQLLLCLYMLIVQYPMLPFDRIANSIMLAFLILQLILGTRAVYKIIENTTAR